MKRLLPQKEKGFTLVELLVVISILAILAVISLAVFSGVQKNARDARRREEIDAISKALETNKVVNVSTYGALAVTMFQAGAVPTDSGNGSATYSVAWSTSAGASAPATPTTWANTSANPTWAGSPTGNGTVAATTNPASGATAWTVCALLEAGNPAIYCKSSQQ